MDIKWEVMLLPIWDYPEGYDREEELFLVRGICTPKNGKAKYVACWCIEAKIEEVKRGAEDRLIMAYDIENGFRNCIQVQR